MKTIFVLTLLAVFVFSLPANDNKVPSEVLKNVFINNGDKGYNFEVETSDGSKRQETGDFRYVGGLAVKGSYEFVDDGGKVHKVNYIADEKGFRPEIID